MKQRYTVGLFFVLVLLLLTICITILWLRHRQPSKMVDPYFYQIEEETNEKQSDVASVFTQDVINPKGYYILYKSNGIGVYLSDKETLFFQTDLKMEDFSNEVLDNLREGIYMESEEDVYHFLESYSS